MEFGGRVCSVFFCQIWLSMAWNLSPCALDTTREIGGGGGLGAEKASSATTPHGIKIGESTLGL